MAMRIGKAVIVWRVDDSGVADGDCRVARRKMRAACSCHEGLVDRFARERMDELNELSVTGVLLSGFFW